ncbi:hypothetical protein WR25_08822 [Diploscapter pachys]|uniref:Uncharacterized protein n=1 Tax=Diploscapter pachys TaxID=2018661 RepID=A0A2A2L1F6_9BILA|nr:hypothetical protein WR25_08822 [Diploscapter pachys]
MELLSTFTDSRFRQIPRDIPCRNLVSHFRLRAMANGTIIRKNEDGQFVDQDNNILPTNDQGQAIFVPSEASTPKPTYQIVDEQGRPLPTDPSTD